MQLTILTKSPLPTYPESVPQTGARKGRYEHRDADFWTCGFFPGSIYILLERSIKFPAHLSVPQWYRELVHDDLLRCGRHWSTALNQMSGRTDTHDMGFIVQPALQKDWELTGSIESRESIIKAANALASRYDPTVGAIRSWDQAINNRYSIVNKDDNFLVIIDSMCNLDLLYYVAHLTQDPLLANIATTHAHTVRSAILREDFSSFHMVNFDPQKPNAVKARMTNQGYDDASTWSRGQAWAIMGFTQTYIWTRESIFLDTAISCANMFLTQLASGKHHHPFVPSWDFNAPQANPAQPLRDTSAGIIAANGLLLIHQALQSLPSDQKTTSRSAPRLSSGADIGDFLDAALRIVQETLDLSLDPDFAGLAQLSAGIQSEREEKSPEWALKAHVVPSGFDAILRNATANNNEHAHKRYWDHGLVYADYYLLEFGNKLCRMGLC